MDILTDAMRNLANALDYAVNICKMGGSWDWELFFKSRCMEEFGKGNPGMVSGMSGIELVRRVYYEIYQIDIYIEHKSIW